MKAVLVLVLCIGGLNAVYQRGDWKKYVPKRASQYVAGVSDENQGRHNGKHNTGHGNGRGNRGDYNGNYNSGDDNGNGNTGDYNGNFNGGSNNGNNNRGGSNGNGNGRGNVGGVNGYGNGNGNNVGRVNIPRPDRYSESTEEDYSPEDYSSEDYSSEEYSSEEKTTRRPYFRIPDIVKNRKYYGARLGRNRDYEVGPTCSAGYKSLRVVKDSWCKAYIKYEVIVAVCPTGHAFAEDKCSCLPVERVDRETCQSKDY